MASSQSPRRPRLAYSHEQFAFGAELHHRGAISVGDPDIVFRIDGHAVRLVLMADDVIADLQDQFVVRVELVQLRASRGFSLEDPEVAFGIQSN